MSSLDSRPPVARELVLSALYRMARYLIVLVLLFLIVQLPDAQVVYYVNPSGADGNDGLSPESAWRTIARVNRASLNPGDQVLFVRGGVWNPDNGTLNEPLSPSSSGTDFGFVTFGAYGTGARPIISLRSSIPGWNSTGNWSFVGNANGGAVYAKSQSTEPKRLWVNDLEYGAAWNNLKGGDQSQIGARYRWYWNSNTLYVWTPSDNPASVYSSIESNRIDSYSAPVRAGDNVTHVKLTSLDVRGGDYCILLPGGNTHWILDSVSFDKYTGWYGLKSGESARVDSVIVQYCMIDRDDGVEYDYEAFGADQLLVQRGNAWDIHHNVFRDCRHSAINLDDGNNGGWTIRYCKIHDNEMTSPLQEYTRALLVNGHEGAGWNVEYNEFYRNYIHNFNITCQFGGRYNKFYYNIWDTMRVSPVMDGFSNYAAASGNYTGARGNLFVNNLIMNCASAGFAIGNNTSSHIDSLYIANNIFYNCGMSPSGRPGLLNVALWIEALSTAPSIRFENNLFFNAGGASTVLWGGYGSQPVMVAQFNSLNGTYNRTIQNNRSGDPKIGWDHKVLVGSDAIDHGVNLNIGGGWDGRDYWGTTVPLNGVADIGVHEWSLGGTTQLDPPTLLSPAFGASDQPTSVVLSWAPVAGATGFDLFLSTDPQFNVIVLQDTAATGTARTVGSLLVGTQYYWRVRARAGGYLGPFSSFFSFSTIPAVPAAPRLESPADSAVGLPTSVVLSWDPVSNVTAYHVQVSRGQQFNPLLINDSSLVVTSRQVTGLAIKTSYYWRVSGRSSGGIGPYSVARTFEIGDANLVTPATPGLRAPPNGGTGVARTALLAWSDVSGASSYWLQVSIDSLFQTVLVSDTSVGGTSRQLSTLSYNATYFWRVAAKNAATVSAFSSAWSFTTDHPYNQDSTQDITAEATPISLVMAPQGSGSKTIEVIRDGIWPPFAGSNPVLQYDTWNGQNRTFDWIGYTFEVPRMLTRLLFEEGIRYSVSGGWFAQLGVQIRSGGQWTDVAGLVSTPTYSAVSGPNYSTYELTFPPVMGDGIRLAGVPGGTGTYISVAELRVFSSGVASLPIGSFTCVPDTLPPSGGNVRLTWSAIAADTAMIDHNIGSIPLNGSLSTTVRSSTDFTLTLANRTGRRAYVASVVVLPQLPKDFALDQNYPNPFNAVTNIIFRVPVACDVFLRVCNILGQQVAVLVNGHVDAGIHLVQFSGKSLSSGVYFFEFRGRDYTEVRRLLLLK